MSEKDVLLKVDGMTCNNCAAGISKSLRSKGFLNADASFIDGEVTFSLTDGKSSGGAIEQIESLGYKVIDSASLHPQGMSTIEKKFLFALLFTVPLFMHMFVPHNWWLNNPLVQLGICAPVYILGFLHFGKSALGSIKARYANMDVLIFLGSTAAFVYSLVGTYLHWASPEVHNYLFFETTATIITLVLLGNVLEHRSIEQTSKYLGELSSMESQIARIILQVGTREKIYETEPKAVKAGDLLQVNEGDRFPVDGIVQSGFAYADESAITGESAPAEKKPGRQVYSGTVNLSGNVRITATAAAQDSTLQKIVELVKKARRDQPEIQKLGDKVSGIFVPVVLAIATLTLLITWFVLDKSLTQSLMNAIAVLVISCPCAMGLATPTAVVAGVGRAAKNGILIKGGSTLERFAKANTIVFDKTGTLTTGHFEIEIVENTLGNRSLAIIKSLEMGSSHPIARSITKCWPEVLPEPLSDISESKGKGMNGYTAKGELVFFGSTPEGSKADLELKIDGIVQAALRISDALKPSAAGMIRSFKDEGFDVILLSGDKEQKVAAVARATGISEYHYGVSPSEKLNLLEILSAEKIVVMVGDGINDGPALSRAQVGIAPGSSSALALDSARIVLMNPAEMESLVMAHKISKHTYLTIKENLFWAFFYNVVAIPIAAAGFLNPMVAALAMAFSDVVVIGNSLRLKSKKLN